MTDSKKDKRKLYFIAIIPPAPFFDTALALKHYFRDRYGSKASLNSPPHITLHMPFQWNEDKEPKLLERLSLFSEGNMSLHLEFNNFGCFPPRVIFIDLKKSQDLENYQQQLHRFCKTELNLFNANYKAKPFHPHLTLAFRDLKKAAFYEAWLEFKEKDFEGEFSSKGFTLLKHNGKQWNVLKEFTS